VNKEIFEILLEILWEIRGFNDTEKFHIKFFRRFKINETQIYVVRSKLSCL